MMTFKGSRKMTSDEVVSSGYSVRENGLVLDDLGEPLSPTTYVEW